MHPISITNKKTSNSLNIQFVNFMISLTFAPADF